MNCGVSKASTSRSRMKPSNIAKQKPLAAVASTVAELPPSHREQSLRSGGLGGDTTPTQARKRRQSTKRKLDATSELDPLSSKRARLTRTSARLPERVNENSEQADKTTPQQPKPEPAERPYISSLESDVSGPEQVSPATLLRKRPIDIDSGSDNNSEHQPKRTRLTRKNLAVFNKMARNKGKKALAYAQPESVAESSTTQTKTISITTSGFADQADKNGILNIRRSKRPENYEDAANRLARSRETASPPESTYRRYIKATGKSGSTEMTVVVEMAPLLKIYDDDDGYSREFNRPCTGLPKDLGFNNGLSIPQPDFIEGLEKREYHPFPIDERVRGAVLYKDDPDSLALPHLAGEWKGPGKDMEEARLQSAYDGAALVHGRSQALDSVGKPYLAGHAKVTTFTTDSTNLNFFAHYAAPSEDGTLEYNQYPITSTNLKNSFKKFKRARRQLRNAQDDARAESHKLRDQLKEYWKARKSEPALLPTIEDNDYEVIEQQSEEQPAYQPTASASSEPKHGKTSSSGSSHSTMFSPPPAVDFTSGSGHKRKTPSSQSSRSHKRLDYWQVDDITGRHFHVRKNGTVTWRN